MERKFKEDENLTKERVPFSCGVCGNLMYNWDEQFFYRHGMCANCSIDWIEDRQREPGKFKSNADKVLYAKQKIAEKQARK